MYYCPCPCSDPSDQESAEENTFFHLPRNLSYVQESFLDAHNVSGRFVYNPRTERRIAADAAVTDSATVTTVDTDPITNTDANYLYHPHHHHYQDRHYTNGIAAAASGTGSDGSGNGSNSSNSIITTTSVLTGTNTTTTTLSSPTPTCNRWCADGTKVDVEFENGISFTGKDNTRDFSPGEIESRLQEVVNNREVVERRKGEGEIGDCIRVKGEDGDQTDSDVNGDSHFSSVSKSRRDPTVHFGCANSPNAAASDFSTSNSKSSVVVVQIHRGLPDIPDEVNTNSSSSGCGVPRVTNTVSSSVPFCTTTTTITTAPSSSSSSSFSSSSLLSSSTFTTTTSCITCLTSSSTPSPSSTTSSSKPSFFRRMTSLLSPKDDETESMNPRPHQHVFDLGSSVDAESTFDNNPDNSGRGGNGDKDDPSQPLILRSPDRSGLVMDRGEDLVVTTNDNQDERIVLLSNNPTTENTNRSGSQMSDTSLLSEVPRSNDSSGEDVQRKETPSDREVDIDGEDCVPKSPTQKPQIGLEILADLTHDLPGPESEEASVDSSELSVVISEQDKFFIQKENRITALYPVQSPTEPDSDAFSEEGVFVNIMIDDEADVVTDRRASDVSDDTAISVDSMFYSPVEMDPAVEDKTIVYGNDGTDEKENYKEVTVPQRMSLEEAINKAASDFNKLTMLMYPDIRASSSVEETDVDPKVKVDVPSTSKAWEKSERLHNLARGSPIHGIPPLNVRINPSKSVSSDVDLSVEQQAVSSESPVYEDHEFNFNRQSLRKSSSLKTNKTPPGTPHRKKVVRFADAMGLDLESVRHVLNTESPPKIPASAMADLKEGLSDDRLEVGSRYLTACFVQPGASNNFVSTVITQKVRLENAIITDLTITGFIRVSNIAFHKAVRVRYTHNNWATFHDIAASYIKDSCDGPTDRFSFSIVAPAHFVTGNRLEFAVSYNAEGAEYWDNNGGQNYAFECFAKTVPTENDREWIHFL